MKEQKREGTPTNVENEIEVTDFVTLKELILELPEGVMLEIFGMKGRETDES